MNVPLEPRVRALRQFQSGKWARRGTPHPKPRRRVQIPQRDQTVFAIRILASRSCSCRVRCPSLRPNEVMIEVHAAGVELSRPAGGCRHISDTCSLAIHAGQGRRRHRCVRWQGCTAFNCPGNRVCFETEVGEFAQFVCVRSEHCFPVPDTISLTSPPSRAGLSDGHFNLAEDGQG